jgi:hypothetical protein
MIINDLGELGVWQCTCYGKGMKNDIKAMVIALHNDKLSNGEERSIKLICLECGRKRSVSPNAIDPRCSCGSVDLEVL